MSDHYELWGGDGSPYSCKMRAYFRYRRINYQWKHDVGGAMFGPNGRFSELKAPVIPVIVRPDGSYTNDSTPIILELEEQARKGERAALPVAAGDAFLAALLEDFGDEWMTKVMFEGRFHTRDDAKFGAEWQFWQSRGGKVSAKAAGAIDAGVDEFAKRQVLRVAVGVKVI